MQTFKSCFAVSALSIGLSFSIAGYAAVEVNPPGANQRSDVKIVPADNHGTVQVTPAPRSNERAQHKRGNAQQDGVGVVPGRKHGNATVLGGAAAKAKRNEEAKRRAAERRHAARDRNNGSVSVKPGNASREGVSVEPARKHSNVRVMSGAEAKRNAEAKRKADAKRRAARDRKGDRGTVQVR